MLRAGEGHQRKTPAKGGRTSVYNIMSAVEPCKMRASIASVSRAARRQVGRTAERLAENSAHRYDQEEL
jgi:hypothetical protein